MSARPIVFVSHKMPPQVFDPLAEASIRVKGGNNPYHLPQDVLLNAVAGVQGLIVDVNDVVGADVMDAAGEDLRVIATDSVGVDKIDIAEANRRGIVIGFTPEILTPATAQHALALIMACARKLSERRGYMLDGLWHEWDPFGHARDLHLSTLGVVGGGRIGGELIKYCRPLFDKVVVFDPFVESAPEGTTLVSNLDTLLIRADVVSLHAPYIKDGADSTYHLFDEHQFMVMGTREGGPPDFINTARGAEVNEQALIGALRQGWLRAAGLDVYEEEPLSLNSELFNFSNVELTPHDASGGIVTRQRMAYRTGENATLGVQSKRPVSAYNWNAIKDHPRWAA